jgi:excisionase family DNA binding protein
MKALVVTMQMDEFEQFIRNIFQNEFSKMKNDSQPESSAELMTIEETQAYLNVSKVTIHKWKKKKMIQSYRIGRKIYFKKHELLESLKSITIKAKKDEQNNFRGSFR